MNPFVIGLIVGLAIAVPALVWFAMRTEKRANRLAERARAAERLAELGTMTGGLAHEIKNPLSSVKLNIQLLQEDLHDVESELDTDSEAADRIGRMQCRFDSLSRETQRLHDILNDFLRFAGRIKLDHTEIDVNELVGELVDFFTPQATAAGVQLRSQPEGTALTVSADRNLLKQAILNLMINATQAMSDSRDSDTESGGNDELIIRAERTSLKTGDEIHIHVIDTGPGISTDNAEKVFHPYFSTKKGGTGLGLPTARRIIEEHGGTLTIHSESGRGTDFQIALPA